MPPLSPELYLRVRARLAALGHGGDYTWAQSVAPPATAEDLVCEYTWVVLNSGMRNTVAQGIMRRVWPALVATCAIGPSVFGHRGKAAAIESVWADRARHYQAFGVASGLGVPTVLAWCDSLPWVGPITKYHLAKNLGVDCAKPDRWLERLAAIDGSTSHELCARLARATGDRRSRGDGRRRALARLRRRSSGGLRWNVDF